MKSRSCFVVMATFLFFGVCCGASLAGELARVNDETITAQEFLQNYRLALSASQAPEKTSEGKTELLEMVIAKRLLSQYFRERGWDTLSAYDPFLTDYEQGQYLQALYYEAIPEARAPGLVEAPRLMELSKLYVDSLQNAYNFVVDEKAVIFLSDRSVVRRVDPEHKHGQRAVSWSDLFTEEEKEMVVATFLGGGVTIGEFVGVVERMPPFVRPTGGNSDQIVLTLEHVGRDKIFEHEFNKLGLRSQPYFRERTRNKREELILNDMFTSMQDTVRVTEEEVREHYEANRDDYVTVPTINLAVMTFESEDVARRAAERVAQGEAFETVAVDFSIYSGSESGYDTTGLFDRGKSAALFDPIWEKEIGATAGPVFDKDHWKVVKLLGRQDPRLLNLEEATPMVVELLKFLRADEALARFIAELRSKAKVEIDYAALEALELP